MDQKTKVNGVTPEKDTHWYKDRKQVVIMVTFVAWMLGPWVILSFGHLWSALVYFIMQAALLLIFAAINREQERSKIAKEIAADVSTKIAEDMNNRLKRARLS